MKYLTFLFVLLTLITYGVTLESEMEFFDYYLHEYTDLRESVADAFTERLISLYSEGYLSYSYVSPLDLLSLLIVETEFRNIQGDSGSSLGYFQIQEDAYFYVRSFTKNKYVPKVYWNWDTVRPLIKLQITVASLYLQYTRIYNSGNSWRYYTNYNGNSVESLKYLHKFSQALSNVSLIYYEYLKGSE